MTLCADLPTQTPEKTKKIQLYFAGDDSKWCLGQTVCIHCSFSCPDELGWIESIGQGRRRFSIIPTCDNAGNYQMFVSNWNHILIDLPYTGIFLNLHHVYLLCLQDLVAVTGAFIGATNIPERWAPPGRLDLICNSHHVMHILVVYAVYHMHTAAVLDLTWMSEIEQKNLSCPHSISTLPTMAELFPGV